MTSRRGFHCEGGRINHVIERHDMTPRRHLRGLSLVEALVAIVILAFALAGIVELFLNSQHQSKRNSDRLQLSILARQQIEELKGAGFDSLQDYFDSSPKDGGAVYYPAEPVEVGPKGGVYAIQRIESAGPRSYRVTVGLTLRDAYSPAETVGPKADFTLTALVEGGA